MFTRRSLIAAVVAVAGLIGLGAAPQARADAQAATDLIRGLGAEAVTVLSEKNMDRQQVETRFRDLLYKGFDTQTIGRFVLGRYWNTATPEQQQEYLRLFADMIVGVYANRFSEYSGEELEILGTRAEGDRDTIVESRIIRPYGAEPVNVAWRVRDRDGTPKIIDVIVEGVSMSVTQRSEFASVIQRGGGRIEALLEVLRQRAENAG